VTLNEVRSHLGLDPYTNPAADRPMVLTATGYVPIEANAGGSGETEGDQSNERGAERVFAGVNAPKVSIIQKYNPDQPRVPAGNSGGGQFAGPGAGSVETTSAGATVDRDADGRTQYAALETDIRSDAPATEPSPNSDKVAAQSGLYVGQFWVTKNPIIDQTSLVLLAILTQVADRIGPRGDLSARDYGTKIHTEFARAVKAEGIPGVEVEQTFGFDPKEDVPYGSKGSIRTDVLLRDPSGTIIAIWDVKTGVSGLSPWRVTQLRTMTGTTLETYVFEMHPDRGVLKKLRLSDWQQFPSLVQFRKKSER
jgi:hypothetical protein